MKNVALVGAAGVGKDTIAQVLVNRYGYRRVAFADALKSAIYEINPLLPNDSAGISLHRAGAGISLRDLVDGLGWDAAKKHPEVRRLLQTFGVTMRDIDPEIWVKAASNEIFHCPSRRPIVFSDVRFINELTFARVNHAAIAVRVTRTSLVMSTENWREHSSETELLETPITYGICGMWDPQEAADTIVSWATPKDRSLLI